MLFLRGGGLVQETTFCFTEDREMAADLQPDAGVLAKIRIPAEYLASLDGMLRSLNRKIIERAAARAAQQGAAAVTREDLLNSVEAIFPAGTSELERVLGEHEPANVGSRR